MVMAVPSRAPGILLKIVKCLNSREARLYRPLLSVAVLRMVSAELCAAIAFIFQQVCRLMWIIKDSMGLIRMIGWLKIIMFMEGAWVSMGTAAAIQMWL